MFIGFHGFVPLDLPSSTMWSCQVTFHLSLTFQSNAWQFQYRLEIYKPWCDVVRCQLSSMCCEVSNHMQVSVRFRLLSLLGFHPHLWFWNGSQTCTNCTNRFCQVEAQLPYLDWFLTVLRQKYVLIASINVSVIYNSSQFLSSLYCVFLLI